MMQHNVTECVISTSNKFLNLVNRARIIIVIKKFYCHVNRFSLQCSRLNDGQNEKKCTLPSTCRGFIPNVCMCLFSVVGTVPSEGFEKAVWATRTTVAWFSGE